MKSDDSLWYYWINDKQGHPSGDVWARTEAEARDLIAARHYNAAIDKVMHYDTYHCTYPMPLQQQGC